MLDFIRGNLFDRTLMRSLPHDVPGFDNDLNEKIDRVMQRAMSDEARSSPRSALGPEASNKDKCFGLLPGLITLLDENGLKMDGVSYTRAGQTSGLDHCVLIEPIAAGRHAGSRPPFSRLTLR